MFGQLLIVGKLLFEKEPPPACHTATLLPCSVVITHPVTACTRATCDPSPCSGPQPPGAMPTAHEVAAVSPEVMRHVVGRRGIHHVAEARVPPCPPCPSVSFPCWRLDAAFLSGRFSNCGPGHRDDSPHELLLRRRGGGAGTLWRSRHSTPLSGVETLAPPPRSAATVALLGLRYPANVGNVLRSALGLGRTAPPPGGTRGDWGVREGVGDFWPLAGPNPSSFPLQMTTFAHLWRRGQC